LSRSNFLVSSSSSSALVPAPRIALCQSVHGRLDEQNQHESRDDQHPQTADGEDVPVPPGQLVVVQLRGVVLAAAAHESGDVVADVVADEVVHDENVVFGLVSFVWLNVTDGM
jgi:hypothetical protein